METQTYFLNILGFNSYDNPSIDEIKSQWRKLIKSGHPDQGGNSEEFLKITKAKEWLIENRSFSDSENSSEEYLRIKKYRPETSEIKKPMSTEFVPTKDQEKALNEIYKFLNSHHNVFLLHGKAGVGKTSIVAQLTKEYYLNGKSVCVSAFTNKATSVIAKKNPYAQKMTLFRLLELKAVEESDQITFDFKIKNKKHKLADPIELYDLILLDEVSMVSDEYYRLLKEKILKYNKKLIVIGDYAQLPPINQITESIAFQEPISYELKEVIRQQKDSNIVKYANQVRNIIDRINTGEEIDIKTKLNKSPLKESGDITFFDNSKPFLDLLLTDFKSPEYAQNSDYVKVIAYRNKTIDVMNDIIRKNIFSDAKETLCEGEQILLQGYGYRVDDQVMPIYDPSQEIVIRRIVDKCIYDVEHHGVKITFPYIVVDVESKDDKKQERINLIYPNQKENFEILMKKWAKEIGLLWNKKEIFRDEFYPFKKRFNLPVYGYAITCHRSQSSTYVNVFLIEDDLEQVKMANNKELWTAKYVSISRASEKLVILNRIK